MREESEREGETNTPSLTLPPQKKTVKLLGYSVILIDSVVVHQLHTFARLHPKTKYSPKNKVSNARSRHGQVDEEKGLST